MQDDYVAQGPVSADTAYTAKGTNMNLPSKVAAAAALMGLFTTTAMAGVAEDRLIEKVVQAYGGDILTSARSLKVVNKNKNLAIGQSASADIMNISSNNASLVIDFENQRKSFTNWNKNRAGTFYNQTIVDGDIKANFDHLRKTRTDNANLQYATLGGGTMRTIDTTLVYVMLEGRENAAIGEDVFIGGKRHETLTFPMQGSPDLTIYVDAVTGLISRMTRNNPAVGVLSYNFSDHTRAGGTIYAASANFQIAGQPNIFNVSRELELNVDVSADFEVPSNYRSAGATLDTSEMQVRELGEGIYYAGLNGGFSIFVDAGDHFVAAGGYAGLPARFDAVKAAAGVDKPLGYQIVTHHHSDHIGGMAEAAALNANLVTVQSHVAPLQAVQTSPLPEDRFTLVDGKMTLADGKVEIYDISTAHSDHYLLVYVPGINLVFSADHFSTNLENGLPPANNNMVTFRTAVEALDLDIDGFIGAHGTRVLTMADLRAATDGYRELTCPVGATLCAD